MRAGYFQAANQQYENLTFHQLASVRSVVILHVVTGERPAGEPNRTECGLIGDLRLLEDLEEAKHWPGLMYCRRCLDRLSRRGL